jgi:UDP-N-acetylglucosamine 2-epimerase (non-hydrolysing)
MKVLCVFGTRPEAIKMAPVIRELRKRGDQIATKVCVTAQHRTMLDQVLELFEIQPDYDLQVMQQNQTLSYITAQVLREVEPVLSVEQPDWVLVQGDTTTTMAASLAAYYQRIKIGHVEAGLRTRNKFHPFPEEINRRIGDVLADLCFAPTESARENLRREAVPERAIRLTGNTVIDALHWVRDRIKCQLPVLSNGLSEWLDGHTLVLITGHRRENFGPPLEAVCLALRDLAERWPRVRFIYPVHLNPNVQKPVYRILSDLANVRLMDPLPYAAFVWLMERAEVILTDSGGVQEEAPALGKPVLVLRETTERPEGIESGNARLVGAGRRQIVAETVRVMEDATYRQTMTAVSSAYGDGRAAGRIVEALLQC